MISWEKTISAIRRQENHWARGNAMRNLAVILLIIVAATGAVAQDLNSTRDIPAKNPSTVIYEPPAVPKQGGDTIEDATVIPGLPYYDTGTTEGYLDDDDAQCPYEGNGAPDVVYEFTPANDVVINVDLCGSGYDTKTYIRDADMNLIACNDDYYFGPPCGDYVSLIEYAILFGGETYYIFVDGYGSEYGPYDLHIFEYHECTVYCPDDAVDEGEPALHDYYEDQYNNGCSGNSFNMQAIDWTNDQDGIPPHDGEAWLCGRSGWYQVDGGLGRDTDWFVTYALETGVMVVTLEAEYRTFLMKLGPPECALVGVELSAQTQCHTMAELVFPVTAGEEIWLWVGPADFSGPVSEFTYFMTVTNNMFDVVPSEAVSWGQVKSMYR